MYFINKITSASPIDYAAEELKKYLRMMMPDAGDVKISFDRSAADGFRLGLMQDFGLDISDAEEPELDDILYIDCDEKGGIIAGDNPRSVLLAVYEYLRQNGCRWLFPGIDGEYIPMQDIKPVKYRFKPSCRYRGQCNEGGDSQTAMLEAIEFTPKVGMNMFMIQFKIPPHYHNYYKHRNNTENRRPEPVSDKQILQWKRQCEAEIAKRGIQLHDIGHGWTSAVVPDIKGEPTPEQAKYMAETNGARQIALGRATNTNFCMSNPEARSIVAKNIVDYAESHSNIDYLHVWLADGSNNHCECAECRKKTPSDWYVILLNEIDEMLNERQLDTRIVFISYVDTTWAPTEETLKNPKRFTMLFAPIFRCYGYSMPDGRGKTDIQPYKRNKNSFPRDLASSFDYFDEWKKTWKGANVGFEYHFWRHQTYYLSGLKLAKLLNDDVKLYKENDVNGIIACGSQRPFFPNGFSFYTFARTLYDTSITYEELLEDYYSTAYGDCWKDIRDYLAKIDEALPFEFFSRDMAGRRENKHYDPERADKIDTIRMITKEGRELIEANYESDDRIKTASMKLLLYHADFCDMIADWIAAKARGNIKLADELLQRARVEFGKNEPEIEHCFDHDIFFEEYKWAQLQKSKDNDAILSV